MRKIAAILLLMLIVFNTIGYKLWFSIAIQNADNYLEASLDNNNYNPQDLITIKIPLNLPYQNISSAFERVDGEITVNGESYKYVQRKVQADTMYLQCISHTEKNILKNKSNNYFITVNDIAGNSDAKKMPGNKCSSIKFDFTDFISHEEATCTLIKYHIIDISYGENPVSNNSFTYLQKLIKPPQSV